MKKKRFPEIDVVRGLAIGGMITYHIIFDLNLMNMLDGKVSAPPFEIMADVTAATFFTVAGISLYISYIRARRRGKNSPELARKYFLRGAKLLTWGFAITAFTYLLFPDMVVVFGALHFIGMSVVLGYLLLDLSSHLRKPLRILSLLTVSVLLFYLSGPVRTDGVSHWFLLPLGLVPPGFQSLDFFPLLPWFGFVVGGLVLGELFYPEGARKYELYEFRSRPAEFLGRNSLWIYFLHQPLIVLGLYLFLLISGEASAAASLLVF